MRLLALCFVLVLAHGGTHALGASDARRATQLVPRDSFRGHGRADTNRVLSLALRRAAEAAGGGTKPCEHFSVEQLIDVKRVLYAARDPALERIYAAAGDSRRLSTFGATANNLAALEQLWADELALLAGAPHLRDAARDAKCYESAMWFTHHVPVARHSDVAQVVALPELPLARTAANADALLPAHAHAAARVQAAVQRASSGCHVAHFFPGTGELANSSTVPRWPATFSADITNCNRGLQRNNCGTWSKCNNTRGKMYYDFSRTVPASRIDLENSACHQFIGNAAPGHDVLPARQYTGPGTVLTAPTADGSSAKYVYWPRLQKCCQCCAEKHGCGVVRPDFMVRGNATSQGRHVMPDDSEHRLADVWLVTGAQDNFLFMDYKTGLPIAAIMNGSHVTGLQHLMEAFFAKYLHTNLSAWEMDRTFYNVSTEPIDASVFEIPSYCSSKTGLLNQCGGEWCAILRTQTA